MLISSETRTTQLLETMGSYVLDALDNYVTLFLDAIASLDLGYESE